MFRVTFWSMKFFIHTFGFFISFIFIYSRQVLSTYLVLQTIGTKYSKRIWYQLKFYPVIAQITCSWLKKLIIIFEMPFQPSRDLEDFKAAFYLTCDGFRFLKIVSHVSIYVPFHSRVFHSLGLGRCCLLCFDLSDWLIVIISSPKSSCALSLKRWIRLLEWGLRGVKSTSFRQFRTAIRHLGLLSTGLLAKYNKAELILRIAEKFSAGPVVNHALFKVNSLSPAFEIQKEIG